MFSRLKGAAEKSGKEGTGEKSEQGGGGSEHFASSSSGEQYSVPFASKFASISLHMNDRIRLMDFPHEIVGLVRQAIQVSWPRGIQEERVYFGSYEFKLRGRPWNDHNDAPQAERLMRTVFEWLYNAGWILGLSTDVSRKQLDKDTLIFRYQHPQPTRCQWTSIGFDRSDRIRLLDAPPELVRAVSQQIAPAVQEAPLRSGVAGAWEAKLVGFPWHASGGETMTSRRLLLMLFAVLEQHGFTVYASIDQKYTLQDKMSETDTWYCCRPLTWTPGAPVYHR